MKRLTVAALVLVVAGMLAGCGGEDKMGTVDLARVQKEAPQAQKLDQQMTEKRESITKELDEAKKTMSDEEFQKKQAQSMQEFNIYGASMQRQFLSDVQGKLGDIAKDKKLGIVVMKDYVHQGGVDVTDELIQKMQ